MKKYKDYLNKDHNFDKKNYVRNILFNNSNIRDVWMAL